MGDCGIGSSPRKAATPPPFKKNNAMEGIHEMKGTLLFLTSLFFNFLTVLSKSDITFFLGAASSICVIVFYVIKIYSLLKKKRDVG